jgi:Ca2+-binding RTX toxin-like protein
MVVLVLPLGGSAWATVLPTLNVEPEISYYNQGSTSQGVPNAQVTLTATLSAPAPKRVQIDWENEGGANDYKDGTATRNTPDYECFIETGSTSCTWTFEAEFTTGIGDPIPDENAERPDIIRAWIDLDQANGMLPGSGQTDDSDQTEGRDETTTPGNQPQQGTGAGSDQCQNFGPIEPDCTDVVLVEVGGLEVAPDLQTVDVGATVSMIARLMAPVTNPNGWNIDFENEQVSNPARGANDPDASSSYTTPDLTCTIPNGSTQCTVNYAANKSGADRWRAWIDYDNTQSTTEADLDEGRYAGPTDCEQPEDPADCEDEDLIATGDANTPGVGCNAPRLPSGDVEPGSEDPSEPDCTDVVEVTIRAGGAATLDCDDRSGAQANNDTERETKVSQPDPATGEDPATEERYRCRVLNQSGGGMNTIEVKAEIENGVNDLDSPDGASYDSPEYRCQTRRDEDALPSPFAADTGVCYITVVQEENETGTAEICFWVGTASEGAALCGDEATGENQQANGNDAGNDLADQTELTWVDQSQLLLNCDPETASNPAGAVHTVTCTATAQDGSTVSDIIVDVEITGAGDPDAEEATGGNTPITPDDECTTGPDGKCSFTHTSSDTGETQYRAWINDEEDEPTFDEFGDEDVDPTEGRDETLTPGRAEPDNTDVVAKTWTPPPTTITMTPETDTAPVGECNPYSITVTDKDGNPVPGAILDVEQRHEKADNQAQNDEPSVSFCEPPASGGPNPSNVDESRGDLRAGTGGENPDNTGTAGGETSKATDQNGRITIGIRVAPGHGSNGTGGTTVTAWWESTDNDDPDAADPKDSSTKSWTPGSGEPGVPAGVNLEPTSSTDHPGEVRTYTATVSDANGDPVEGAAVTWTEEGVGEFVNAETSTDASGQAQAQVTSNEPGTQTITVSAADCAPGATCEDTSTQVWEEAPSCPGHANDSRNQIAGTPGDDVLRGTGGADVICGLGGNDTLIGAGGNDLLIGGGGNDILRGNAGNDRLNGAKGEDTLEGGGGKDRLIAGSEDDVLEGGGANDVLLGSAGKDVLRGSGGNDMLRGEAGNDNLNGGRGKDTLNGGPGQDTCASGGGSDRISSCE